MTVQLAVLTPTADGLDSRVLNGVVKRLGGPSDSDGLRIGPGLALFRVVHGSVSFGDVIVYGGQHYRVDVIEQVPPFHAHDVAHCTLRADADAHATAALANLRIDEEVEIVIDAQLLRRTGPRSTSTGYRGFAAAADVKIKVRGIDELRIDTDRSLADAKHAVTLYGEAAEAGDRLRWGGRNHDVKAVTGLVKDTDGARYSTSVVTT